MNKNYIAPEVDIHETIACQMMAESAPSIEDTPAESDEPVLVPEDEIWGIHF